jgi:Tfp pilus assembly protein PilF
VVSVERALNIEPRNAQLTYQLALFRLKQEKPELAEDLARKAALLAGTDKSLKNRAWILIAQARQAQGDQKGAKQAREKASSFEQN